MKLLILSDVHANWPALQAIEESADAILFVGDAINYGPTPSPCVKWVKDHAAFAVCGNHDYAIPRDADPQCSELYRQAASEVGAVHRRELSPEHSDFLKGLPLTETFTVGGARFLAVHASPSNPLYGYYPPQDIESQAAGLRVDVLCVGHTHLPAVLPFQGKLLINPGSVGQPKDGDPRASYAVWEDGKAEIRRVAYDIEAACRGLDMLGVSAKTAGMLKRVLRSGGDQLPAPVRGVHE